MCYRTWIRILVIVAAAGGVQPVSARAAALRVNDRAVGTAVSGADASGPRRPETPAESEVDALVAEALERNPDLLALREAVEAARTRPAQARALPDPMVSLVYRNDGWGPSLGEMMMTNLAFMGSQTLPWPGKLDLRGAIAEREAEITEERQDRARLGLIAGIRRAYWDLVLARETTAVLREQAEVWGEAEGVALARYTVGQGAQQDVLRAQVEITRFEQLRVELEAEAEARQAELDRLVGRDPSRPVVVTGRLTLRPDPRGLEALLAEAEARSPELRAIAVAGERERHRLDLARKDFKPDFSVQAGYMNRGGLDPMWQAGVGISLPVRRTRLHAGVAEAEARRRSAARQLEAARDQLRFRTRERLAALRSAERRARLYADGLIPQAQLSYEAALANYQAGRLPFLTVLEALSTLYADRVAHLQLLAAHERLKAALDEAGLDAAPGLPMVGAATLAGAGMAARGPGSMSGPVED